MITSPEKFHFDITTIINRQDIHNIMTITKDVWDIMVCRKRRTSNSCHLIPGSRVPCGSTQGFTSFAIGPNASFG